MATVTAYTAQRMKQIEDASIVGGRVSSDNLILTRFDGTEINAGNVRGPQGETGTTGGIADAPSNNTYYVRRNSTWVASQFANAPADGHKYAWRNNAWVRVERAWKIEYTNAGPTPPAGWAVGGLATGEDWSVKFSGSGNLVQYNFNFHIAGTDLNSNPRITLPTVLRPVHQVWAPAYLRDVRTGYVANGHGLAFIETTGVLTVPRGHPAIITQAEVAGSPNTGIFVYNSLGVVQVYVSGTFIRSGADLPPTATYVD